MKKILSIVLIMIAVLPILTGCTASTFKSYTYKVETGDKIKIKMDTNDGYDLSKDLPFTISKDDTELSKGTFLKEEGYSYYDAAIKNDKLAKVIDSGTKDKIDYTFYTFNNTEYNYLIKVKDSKTGLIIVNKNSDSEAKEIFERLTITKE